MLLFIICDEDYWRRSLFYSEVLTFVLFIVYEGGESYFITFYLFFCTGLVISDELEHPIMLLIK